MEREWSHSVGWREGWRESGVTQWSGVRVEWGGVIQLGWSEGGVGWSDSVGLE